MAMGLARGLCEDNPFVFWKKGGMAMGFAKGNSERFLGFYGVIYSRKAIRIARETNRQTAMRSPFPCRKGGRGDRSCEGHRG